MDIHIAELATRLSTARAPERLAVLSGIAPEMILASPPLSKAVVSCLSDEEPRVRALAFERLRAVHDVCDTSVPELLRFLDSADGELCGLAAICLALRKRPWSKPLSAHLRRKVVALLKHTSPTAQRGGLRLAEQVTEGDRRIAWETLRLIQSPDAAVSSAAGRAARSLKIHPAELHTHLVTGLRAALQSGKRDALPGIAAAFADLADPPFDEIGLLPPPIAGESEYELAALQLACNCGCIPEWGWPVILAAMQSGDLNACELACLAWQQLLCEKGGRGFVAVAEPRSLIDALDGLHAEVAAGRLAPGRVVTAVVTAYRRTTPVFDLPAQPPDATDPQFLLRPLALLAARQTEVAAACRACISRMLASTDFSFRAAAAQLVQHMETCTAETLARLIAWIERREANEIFAVRALGAVRSPDPRALAALSSAFGGTTPETHEAAAIAIGQYGPNALAALPTLLRYHAFREGESTGAREAIAKIVRASRPRTLAMIRGAGAEIFAASHGGLHALLTLIEVLLPEVAGEPELPAIVDQVRNEIGLRILLELDAVTRTELDAFDSRFAVYGS